MIPEERRRQSLNAMPKTALSSMHLEGAALVNSRLTMLDKLPKGIRAAELGVADGKYSMEIWKRLKPSHLTLVDTWDGERFAAGHQKVQSLFADQIGQGMVSISRSLSVDFLESCSENSLDFIYIDTDHSYKTTIQELRQADRVLSPNGFIAGHDYKVGNIVRPLVYGVIQAVSQFCVENKYKFKYLSLEPAGGNSFCLVRI